MRSLSVIIAMLVSGTISAQAYNCGMFGMLEDSYGETYVARFYDGLESISLESALTCETIVCDVKVFDVKHRRYNTVIWITIEHPKFNDVPYRIKYPTGSWGVVNKSTGQ